MKHDFFKTLPSEIILNILSRLPLRTLALSKCVCKPWLGLLENDEFINSHLSKSGPALAVLMPEGDSNWCVVFEFKDELNLESHDHHYNQLTKFDFPHRVTIVGSANGLLFLHKNEASVEALYVCNPISREYIDLRCPPGFFNPKGVTYGFGASKISSQLKVVQIIPNSACHVYTLGTGSWRRVEGPSASFRYRYCMSGAFVNGNLHWLVSDSIDTSWISCFDLETECFSTLYVPPLQGKSVEFIESLSCLRDCLCLCDNMSDDEIVLWLMKEYGDEKSWTKEYVIGINYDFDRDGYVFVYPIKVFKDGDILMVWDDQLLFYYSNKTKTTQEIGVFGERDDYINSILLSFPSFLSLKSFPMENVISL